MKVAWVWPRFWRMHYLRTAACLCLSTLRLPVCHSQAAPHASSQLSVAAAYAANCCRATQAIGSTRKRAQRWVSIAYIIPSSAVASNSSRIGVPAGISFRGCTGLCSVYVWDISEWGKTGEQRGRVWSMKLHSIQVLAEASKQTPRWSDKVKEHCGCRQRAMWGGRDVCPVWFWWRIDSESECVSESGNECFC